MREALFVRQHAATWKACENLQGLKPDELAGLFITITDDLAYAKTFYPGSKTTLYLNGLAAGLHQSIYKNKKTERGRLVSFWKYELPGLFYRYRRQLVYALFFFITAAAIGALSAKYDEQFVRLIMGDDYVDMTDANIAAGNPFGVYKTQREMPMFLYIAVNNSYVSFLTFISGIFIGIGPVYHLLRNGIMLGAFEYYFFSRGLGMESVLVIWIHGTLEISCIIIAGGAGLVMGHGLLFPKTYTRLQAFKKSAADGTKMAAGVIPLLVVAAFLEGFVTRHTGMPVWLSGSILLSSLGFILWYVVIYPAQLHQRHQLNAYGTTGRI